MTDRRKILIALTVAVAARLGLLFGLHDKLAMNYGPSLSYGEVAQNLSRGRGFSMNMDHLATSHDQWLAENRMIDPAEISRPESDVAKPVYHMLPGYGYLLAATFKLFGERYIYLQTFQALLDSVSVVLIFLMVRPFFGSSVSFLAALLYALWIPEARLTIVAYHDGFLPFLTVLANYFFIRGLVTKRYGQHIWAGAVLGVSGWFRTDMLMLPLFWILCGWFYAERKKFLIHQAFAVMMIFLVLVPWGLRNQKVFGKFAVARTLFWHTAWLGMGEFDNPVGAVASDEATLEMVQRERPDIELKTPAYEAHLRGKVLSAIINHPGWFAGTVVKRTGEILYHSSDWGFPVRDESAYDRHKAAGGSLAGFIREQPLQATYRIIPKAARLVGLVLAFWGFWISKKRWRETLLFLATPAYAVLSHAPLYYEARIILPGLFGLHVFIALAWAAGLKLRTNS